MTTIVLAALLWTAPVEVPTDAGPWAAAAVPGDIELRTGGDLDRVRLLDPSDHEIPYRIVDPARDEAQRWQPLEARNRRRTDDGWLLEVLIPEGTSVDALRLSWADGEGVDDATVRGPDDGVIASQRRLGRLGDTVVDTIELEAVDLDRLLIELVGLVGDLEPGGVLGRIRRSPFESIAPLPIVASVSGPVDSPDGRMWNIGLPTPAVRIDRLQIEVAAPTVFRRRIAVDALERNDADARWTAVGGTVIERVPLTDGRPGLERLTIPIRPGAWRLLRLREPDGSERPLDVTAVRARPRPRWLLIPVDGDQLRLAAGTARRSRTLEDRTAPVDVAQVARARIGTLRDLVDEADEPIALDRWWVTPLFLAAALLLAWLAWRLLVRGRPS